MTELHNPAVKVRVVGGATYVCARNGNTIIYRPNQAQMANIVMENTDSSLDSVFAGEKRVDVLIENDLMMTGYVTRPAPNLKNFKKMVHLQIADWIGYLASKSGFEKNYDSPITAATVFVEAAQTLTDGTTRAALENIDLSIDTKIAKDYMGCSTKEVFQDLAKSANAAWYGKENQKVSFFGLGSKVLREPGGNIYSLVDRNPASAGEIPIKLVDWDHNFSRDSTYKFRNVKVLNGLIETWPPTGEINWLVTDRSKDPNDNDSSNHFFFMSKATEHLPTFEAGPAIGSEGDYKTPAISFSYGTNPALTMYCYVTFVNPFVDLAPDRDFVGLKLGQFERLKFFVNFQQGSSLQGLQKLELRLVDDTNSDYYFRDVLPDIIGVSSSDGYVWLDYPLPIGSLNNNQGPASDNGWQKSNPGAVLDEMSYLLFKPTPSEGWAPDTKIKFAMMHFWRRLSVTKSGPGYPATTKLITVNDQMSRAAMLDLANKEYSRVSQDIITATGTIEGNTVFKNPGYAILFDYTNTIDPAATAVLPMREIIHRIHGGRYTTTIVGKSTNEGI